MKAELRQAWIDALESGEYTQTQSALHDEQGFCGLGVLADVLVKRGEAREDRTTDPDRWRYEFDAAPVPVFPYFNILPFEALGIPSKVGDDLWKANDLDGLGFDEIAKIVRRDVPVEDEEPVKEIDVSETRETVDA